MISSCDRVRKHTADAVLRRMDGAAVARIERIASASDAGVARHLDALEREWDTDRVIETEASLTGLAGLALGAAVDRRFLAVPAFVGAAVLLHALSGWYPLLPLLRRLGVRSASEIARERYAAKALRGDFAEVTPEMPAPTA